MSRGVATNSRRRCTLDDDELRRLRTEGLTYDAIAALAGVSRQGVALRLRKQGRGGPPILPDLPSAMPIDPPPTTGALADPATPIRAFKPLLSVRAFNALMICGLGDGTVADVRALGTQLLRTPNLGIKSFAELCGIFGIVCEPFKSRSVSGVYYELRRRNSGAAQ